MAWRGPGAAATAALVFAFTRHVHLMVLVGVLDFAIRMTLQPVETRTRPSDLRTAS